MKKQKAQYIIVGAGSSGCPLAYQLVSSGHSVILIEAGADDFYPWIHLPVGYFRTMGNYRTDWCYRTQKDPGLAGRSIKWPRGKVVGGSSSINGLLWVRGQREDYDQWQKQGLQGWGWKQVLPAFKEIESWSGRESDLRGREGKIKVEDSKVHSQIVQQWVQAAARIGYPINPDYNSGDQNGVALFQLTTHRGLRCSAAKGFLDPIRDSPLLDLRTELKVERVILRDKRAVSVQVSKEGSSFELQADREIILCAGAINSPQILMLSGIGNSARLKQANIVPLVDLHAVGLNLQDHLQARPVYKCTLPTINTSIKSAVWSAHALWQYMTQKKGVLTMAASLGTGFLKTRLSPDRPDIQFHIQPFSADDIQLGPHHFSAITSSVLQLRPQSRGQIRLNPQSPKQAPLIVSNYLKEQLDQATIVEGIKVGRKIARQPQFSKLILEQYGSLKNIPDQDYRGLLQWARRHSTTIYHPTSTTRMGLDEKSVVDGEMRVHGVKGLRVCDAGVMRKIVSGNTNSCSIMLGFRLGQLMLKRR